MPLYRQFASQTATLRLSCVYSFGGSRSGGSLGSGMGSAPRLGSSSGYSSFLGPGIAGGYGYGYNGGFGGPVVVQRSDGGGGLITIVVLVAAFLLVTQVASRFLGGGDGDSASGVPRSLLHAAECTYSFIRAHTSIQRRLLCLRAGFTSGDSIGSGQVLC